MTANQSNDAPKNEAYLLARNSPAETLLCAHPGVKDAAIVCNEAGFSLAFVVPDDRYVEQVLSPRAAEVAAVEKWRKASDLNLLAKEAATAPVGLNTTGWNSSYTRQPIPIEQMREWVDTSVAEILQLAPKMVYEIGCGTGMLLMRIAPHCDRYVAVDFSPVVLNRLSCQLQTLPSLAGRTEFIERSADNFNGIEEGSFDTVVLNSIVQYFPNAVYLTNVLEKAINAVRPGGSVFVGDVRHLNLHSVFASSVEIFQAQDETVAEELRSRVRRRIDREPELLISPAFFLSLRSRISKLSRVEIRPRLGHADNEMTLFRYNAILHVGYESTSSRNDRFHNWEDHKWTVEKIRSILTQHPDECIGITRIRNRRIERDCAALATLRDGRGGQTAEELRSSFKPTILEGIHPQALMDLQTEGIGFGVFLSWAACTPNGSFDAYFIPTKSGHGVTAPDIDWPAPETSAFVQLTNSPGQNKARNDFIRQLKAHCSQNLPENNIPNELTLVDAVVRSSDGDVDRLSLFASLESTTF